MQLCGVGETTVTAILSTIGNGRDLGGNAPADGLSRLSPIHPIKPPRSSFLTAPFLKSGRGSILLFVKDKANGGVLPFV